MTRLENLAEEFGTDKFEHGYCPLYEKHIPAYSVSTLVEIGIATGASLRMWTKYFGPNTQIIGIDNNPDVLQLSIPGATIVYGDATEQEILFNQPTPDLIIDDGSHEALDIMRTFNLLWPRLPNGAWYVIEDLATQFNERWGGHPTQGSIVTELIHGAFCDALVGSNCAEVHIYQEIVFLRKA